MKYEIHIGSYFDVAEQKNLPKLSIPITQEQLKIIEMFADTRKSEKLEVIYRINDCEFSVVPIIEINI